MAENKIRVERFALSKKANPNSSKELIVKLVEKIEANDPTIYILDLTYVDNLPAKEIIEALKKNQYITKIMLGEKIDEDFSKYINLLNQFSKLKTLKIIHKGDNTEIFVARLEEILSSLSSKIQIGELEIDLSNEYSDEFLTRILSSIDADKLKIDALSLYLGGEYSKSAFALNQLLNHDNSFIKKLDIQGSFPLFNIKINKIQHLSFSYIPDGTDHNCFENLKNYLQENKILTSLNLNTHSASFEAYKDFLSVLVKEDCKISDLAFSSNLLNPAEINEFLASFKIFGKKLLSFEITLPVINNVLAESLILDLNQNTITNIGITSLDRGQINNAYNNKIVNLEQYAYAKFMREKVEPAAFTLRADATNAAYELKRDGKDFKQALKELNHLSKAQQHSLKLAYDDVCNIDKYVDAYFKEHPIASAPVEENLSTESGKKLSNFLKQAINLKSLLFKTADFDINSPLVKAIIKSFSPLHALEEISFNGVYHPDLLDIQSLTRVDLAAIHAKSDFYDFINKLARHTSIVSVNLYNGHPGYPLLEDHKQILQENPYLLELANIDLNTMSKFVSFWLDSGKQNLRPNLLDKNKVNFNAAVKRLDGSEIVAMENSQKYKDFDLLLKLHDYLPLYLHQKFDLVIYANLKENALYIDDDSDLLNLVQKLTNLPQELLLKVNEYLTFSELHTLFKLLEHKAKIKFMTEQAAIETKEDEVIDQTVYYVNEVNYNIPSFIDPYQLLKISPGVLEDIKAMPEWMLQELEKRIKQQGLEKAVNELLSYQEDKIDSSSDIVNVIISVLKSNNVNNIEEIIYDYFANTVSKEFYIDPAHQDRLFLEYVTSRIGQDILLRFTFQQENQEIETYEELIKANDNNKTPLVIDFGNVDKDYLIGYLALAPVHRDLKSNYAYYTEEGISPLKINNLTYSELLEPLQQDLQVNDAYYIASDETQITSFQDHNNDLLLKTLLVGAVLFAESYSMLKA